MLGVAAYDPVFFLHHSNIDRQYAYWQKLQELRKKSTKAKPKDKDFPLPPFSSKRFNPFYDFTGLHPTQLYGLEYKKHYNYEYDYLLFDGATPEDFLLQESIRCHNKTLAAIVEKDRSIRTRNNMTVLRIDNGANLANISNVFHTLGVHGVPISPKPLDYDLTFTLTNCGRNNKLCSLYGLNTKINMGYI